METVGLTSQCPLRSALGTSRLLCQRLSVPFSVCAAGKGITCELVLSLSGFLVFTFVEKHPPKTLERGWKKGKTECNRYFYIIIELFGWERESWKFSDDLKHFHFFGKALAEVVSGFFWLALPISCCQLSYSSGRKLIDSGCCRTVCSLMCFVSVTVPSPHFKF